MLPEAHRRLWIGRALSKGTISLERTTRGPAGGLARAAPARWYHGPNEPNSKTDSAGSQSLRTSGLEGAQLLTTFDRVIASQRGSRR
jgi:hypothetical protein